MCAPHARNGSILCNCTYVSPYFYDDIFVHYEVMISHIIRLKTKVYMEYFMQLGREIKRSPEVEKTSAILVYALVSKNYMFY